jgi:hypothetical protein
MCLADRGGMLSRALWLASLVTLSAACGAPREPAPPVQPAPPFSTDGRVIGVERKSPDDPGAYVHLLVAADGERPIRVELAPGWYLDQQGLRFSREERVSVEGHRERRAGDEVVVARRLRRGAETIELRDDHDRPRWQR